MRRIPFILLVLLTALQSRAQIGVVFQTPVTGVLYKPQLWSMVLSNTTQGQLLLHVEATITPAGSSQPILTGITRAFTLPIGTRLINVNDLMPIQYSSTAPTVIDINPMSLLPIGEFEVCYQFFRHNGDVSTLIAEECRELLVEPLSPPQLVYPFDQTSIEEERPQLIWLPPLPAQMVPDLNYDLRLVALSPNQSAADAIQQNVPLLQVSSVTTPTLPYPLGAPALVYQTQYAWQVTAKSGTRAVAQSEIWQFDRKQFAKLGATEGVGQPFIELRRDPETAYGVVFGDLQFVYTNETTDSVWQIAVIDLSQPNQPSQALALDSTPLKRGQNFVRKNLRDLQFFLDRHIYQLDIKNSRNEVWRLRYEYREPSTTTNN